MCHIHLAYLSEKSMFENLSAILSLNLYDKKTARVVDIVKDEVEKAFKAHQDQNEV